MRKTTIKKILQRLSGIALLMACCQTTAIADDYTSTVILNADNTVTFTLHAPGAEEVEIDGDMLKPKYKIGTAVAPISTKTKRDMTLRNGEWVFTTGHLSSDMYTYHYIVDDKWVVDRSLCLPAGKAGTVRDIADTCNYFILPGGTGDYFLDNDVPHGTMSKVWHPSNMERWAKRRMTVYTPPSYDADTAARYPVLYLLHGSGGDEDAWQEMGRVARILDNMIAQGKVQPLIVVMPNGNVELEAAPGEGTDKSVQPSASNMASMLGEMEYTFVGDVVAYTDSNYRTIADRQHRAIAGLSLGGLHTLFTAVNNPETFDYIALFSAQTTNALSNKRIGLLSSIKETIAGNKLLQGLSGKMTGIDGKYLDIYRDFDDKLDNLFAAKPAMFYIAYGTDDFVKKLNTDLCSKLDKKGYAYTLHETEGGHTWMNWRHYLIDILPRIFKNQK